MKFLQCKLVKGNLETTSWIPAKFAVVGKGLKLKDDYDNWSYGWVVKETFGETDEKNLPDWRKAIRGHRKSTGDSNPKVNDA